jgi:cyclic beta-1,2-glucan synthetase
VSYAAEWVLGVGREQTQMHVVTSMHEPTGALLATNAFHPELPGQVAFLHVLASQRSATGDRAEILGDHGSFQNPAGLKRAELSGRTGAGLDPAGAVQTSITLAPGEATTVVFLIGAGSDLAATERLLEKYSTHEAVENAIDQMIRGWDETLTAIQVKTPNRALDLLVNRWLLYQTLSCRVWGRSAYYQSGGAYGFRDQLQDVMALVYCRPELARQHLLRAASRQFQQGDVQHWWHPPQGRGTRTRFSDDLLWLPFVVAHYVAITQDQSVLDEQATFLTSPLLDEHEQERYELPTVSSESASLYEHCLRAIRHGFRLGPHGLPLMGCGDWNDGMNKVGERGRGESIWVGWFLLVLLKRFLPIMAQRGDQAEAGEWQTRCDALRAALEGEAWDGGWYRRAYFDDGQPLGSATNEECQIDSIAQTWAVLAQAQPQRALAGIEAVWDRLVLQDQGLVLLFTPPFDKSTLDPGYIKGYLPGIRENGGQYTHPALWLIEALTLLDDGERAMQIFDLINPIHHASDPTGVERYQVEPYVIAADVYGVPPHTGRGGWTWYTGSAAWTYRAALEFILGFRQSGDRIAFQPQVPPNLQSFDVTIRQRGQTRRFRLERGNDSVFREQGSRGS